MPTWIYAQVLVKRQTCRHAAEDRSRPWLRRTRDGRYLKAFMFWSGRERRLIGELMREAGLAHDLDSDQYRALAERAPGDAAARLSDLIDRLCAALTAEGLFHRAQAQGLLWASVRYPEENLAAPHFQARGTFQAIDHPELNRALYYPASVATDGRDRATAFARGAPRLGEHTREVLEAAGLGAEAIAQLKAAGAI